MPARSSLPDQAKIRMYSKPAISPAPGASRFAPGYPPARQATLPLPKEQLTAWQRWEMTSFAEELGPAPYEEKAVPASVLEPLEPALLIDEAALDSLRLEAQMAGEKAGYQQGYTRGQAEGYAAAMTAVREQAEHLRALTLALPTALRVAEREVADDLMALALDIAQQVLGQAITVEPQAILAVVRELLQAEPALAGAPQLILHPDDASLIKEHLPDDLQAAGWRIRADATTNRGGCRVLATSGERDATLETRWERVAAMLARNPPAFSFAVHD